MIPLEQKAFDLIVSKLGEALEKQEFKRIAAEPEDGVRMEAFAGENLAYAVMYTMKTKRIELKTCAMTDDGPDKNWKSISSWLYDPQEGEDADVESIINDFCETVEGPKRVAALQTAKKKRSKNEENNADPVFMFNRFANIYPELRMDLIDERSTYATVRPIAFTRAHILPRVQGTLSSSAPESQPVQRLAELCNDLYENGDFDVRAILTMVLLNGLDETAVKEKLVPHFSDDMQKGYKAGLKMRGKKVKPEKVKKQSRVVAEALKNNQGAR